MGDGTVANRQQGCSSCRQLAALGVLSEFVKLIMLCALRMAHSHGDARRFSAAPRERRFRSASSWFTAMPLPQAGHSLMYTRSSSASWDW